MEPAANPELFSHIRVVMGMVVSLSMARLLTGLAGFVQHPHRARLSFLHLGWTLFMFLFLIHFWWWEFRLHALPTIDFGVYVFVIAFCCVFFFLCVLLFPVSIEEYAGYEAYFLSRRAWFFGFLALAYALDLVDTALKGRQYFGSFGLEYPLRNAFYMAGCLIAGLTSNRLFQKSFVVVAILYQIFWIYRAFDMLN